MTWRVSISPTHVFSIPNSPTIHGQRPKDDVEVLLALPQDIHDRALKSFATTCEGEERCGSRRPAVCIKGYPSYQFFNVECLVHRKKCGGWIADVDSKPGRCRGKTETGAFQADESPMPNSYNRIATISFVSGRPCYLPQGRTRQTGLQTANHGIPI